MRKFFGYKINKGDKLGLIQEYVDTLVSSYSVNHYRNKGYDCYDGKRMRVKVQDLPRGSGVKIDVQCDYCKKIFSQAYRRYLEHPDDIACKECRYSKVSKTNLKRYGNTCSLHNKEVHEKVLTTWKEKYGVTNPFLSKTIRDKSRKTMLEKYGVEYTAQSTELMEKMNATLLNKGKDGFIYTSKMQNYLCNLFGGELNYKIGSMYIDIFLPEYNICCEYDGGGHNLCVCHKRMTQEEMNQKDEKRNIVLVKSGYKVFRIVSARDKQLPDEEFIKIKNKAIDALINKQYDVYIYDIDKKSEKSFNV